MKPGTFCIKPKKSAAPSQAECAEQCPKVTQVGGVTKREYCATAPLIVAFPPQSQRAIAFCTSSERCAASCLPPCYTPFFLPMHISILHVRRAKQGAERGREGGRTGGHLSESAASLAQATDATPPSSSSPLPLANIDTRDAGNSQVSPLFSLQ